MPDDLQMNPDVNDMIQHIDIRDEMTTSYIDYSMSVIIGRALPDARDGLKPVHRRCLYAMQDLGNTHNKPHKKSARVVGDVIGKYHPHGDSAVYDTIVRLAQPFSMRYKLVDGHGNFGSIDGDPAAAQRYTEVRMERIAEELLADLDKDTVNFGPNYDESLTEPLVLPSKLPNLLLNGSIGIAVGMATNIPPHNLGEIVDAICYYIDNRECEISELMRFVKGPDFPTGAIICGTKQIEAMYKLGRGQMIVRARTEIVEERNREVILVSEIPYGVNKAQMISHIASLVNEKTLEGISDIRDESSEKDGVRVVIEVKRGHNAQVVLNNLFKHTQLQTTFGAIMLAIHDNRPKVMNLKELITCHVDHRFDVLTRRTRFELRRAEARQHIVEGLLKALDVMDEIVALIRAASGRDAARAELIARYAFSERQADAILEMRLYQLTGLERDKVENEHRELAAKIDELKQILADPALVFAMIKDELIDMKQKYGDKRRTEIAPLENEVQIEDLIADEACVVTMSKGGYIKRTLLTNYHEQRRGGKGVIGATAKEEDIIDTMFVVKAHDTLLFLTNRGRLFGKRAFEIPELPRTSAGKAIVNFLELQEGEKVATLLRVREFDESTYLFFATQNGIVKRTKISAYKNVNRRGIIALNIRENDALLRVALTKGDDTILLATENGKSIRFTESRVRAQGRQASGVRGIRLIGDDKVCALTILDPEATYLCATENGFGKHTPFEEYRETARGGQGIIAIKTAGRNGKVIGACAVKQGDSLLLMTAKGMMVRIPVAGIREVGRNSQGVKLISLSEEDKLLEVVVIAADNEEAEENAADVPEVIPEAVAEEPIDETDNIEEEVIEEEEIVEDEDDEETDENDEETEE